MKSTWTRADSSQLVGYDVPDVIRFHPPPPLGRILNTEGEEVIRGYKSPVNLNDLAGEQKSNLYFYAAAADNLQAGLEVIGPFNVSVWRRQQAMRATAAEASAAASTNLDRSQQSRTFSSELSKMVGMMNYPSASKAQVLGDEFTYLGHASRRSPSTAAEVSAETQREGSEEKKGEQGDVA